MLIRLDFKRNWFYYHESGVVKFWMDGPNFLYARIMLSMHREKRSGQLLAFHTWMIQVGSLSIQYSKAHIDSLLLPNTLLDRCWFASITRVETKKL